MIETRRLKNVVISVQTILSFVLSRKIINIYNDIARKYGNVKGLYFSIQPDKIRKSEIFTTFEKIHRSFLNNLKSEETKSQIKAHLSYLANSYFYNYKPSPRILREHRVLRNLRKNKNYCTIEVFNRSFLKNNIEKKKTVASSIKL